MTIEEHQAAIAIEQAEWAAIRDAKIAEGKTPTAFQVTLEQKKRQLARGEKSATAHFLKEANAGRVVVSCENDEQA